LQTRIFPTTGLHFFRALRVSTPATATRSSTVESDQSLTEVAKYEFQFSVTLSRVCMAKGLLVLAQ
jgi:hypothetical protein